MAKCRKVVLRPRERVIIFSKSPIRQELLGKTLAKGETIIIGSAVFDIEDIETEIGKADTCTVSANTGIVVRPHKEHREYESDAERRWRLRAEGRSPTPCGVPDAPGCYELEDDSYKYMVCDYPTKIRLEDKPEPGRVIYYDDRVCEFIKDENTLYCHRPVMMPVSECMTPAMVDERMKRRMRKIAARA